MTDKSFLGDLLNTMEIAGTSAVMEALKDLRVVRFDPQRMSWKFTAVEVTDEVLDRSIRRKLGRSS